MKRGIRRPKDHPAYNGIAWYALTADERRRLRSKYYSRQRRRIRRATCLMCKTPITPQRSTKETCSDRCRQAAWRQYLKPDKPRQQSQ